MSQTNPTLTAADENSPAEHRDTASAVVSKTKALADLVGNRVEAAEVRSMLPDVIDPELGINIVDLGLIYDIDVYEDEAHVQMTLTSPACPMGPYIMSEAKAAVECLHGVSHCEITLVWEPYWTPDRIDPRLRAYMGF